MKSLSLQQKFLLIVGGSTAILLVLTAIGVVSFIGNQTRQQVENEVQALVNQEAGAVERFFNGYGGTAKGFLSSPFVQNFFAANHRRGAPESQIEDIGEVYKVFTNISSADENIKSAFFGSAITGEYFFEDGRVGVDETGPDAGDPKKGYFTTERPWFNTAVQTGELYVTPPAVDSQDGSVSAVVQGPVYREGKLIGVGGVDILISTIGEVIDSIQYKGQGTAFLVDSEQKIVYFPSKQAELPLSTELSSFDQRFDHTQGFAELSRKIAQRPYGLQALEWNGQPHVVVFKHATLTSPKMDWTLAVLIPESVISDPIFDAITSAILASAVIIALIMLITWWATKRITSPLLTMRLAMADIASGNGDLTQRLVVQTSDEIGQLAAEFNRFTDRLRSLLQQTSRHTQAVAEASAHLREVSQNSNTEIQQERHLIDNVSSAVTQMAATVVEISNNAAESSKAATDAESRVHEGKAIAGDAMAEIRGLAKSIHDGVELVSGLSEESENIGAVIDVINSIADQTNLLALNAAIEAARAGELGRGFAVVADEVRSLASRTQDSTDDIRKMVERLQSMALRTDSMMQQGRDQSLRVVEKTESVVESLEQINTGISTVQAQSSHIALATEQQTIAAEEIHSSLVTISGLSDKTSQNAEALAVEATQLSGVSSELKELVSQFKI
ncbi:methyl-accepting chemotaxis protein [Alteromonas aestuariivivens]|uniref:Methyl-accepting chemotaxis protein n=1 Tax=Alteromonas aestuariivivens TaxID=1938339 RepID=A0A3D8M7F4_9ALTE|nr:methyl-accepting chemotaxis protein [Alteromonas aestuariivivens]RDV25102.1 methyl-accepting chemotaxis protein [Alteromonas aestuariivivens]